MKIKPKIIVILGQTATGKSDLAVDLAKTFEKEKKQKCEIISADSRQVYKNLDIGSGKITKKEMRGVPHHLLDVVSPNRRFSVADFQKMAYEKIDDILKRGKLPIICGGTGFYIQSIVDGLILPEISANYKLRKTLEQKNLEELQIILKNLDVKKYKEIDSKNKIRLIRAIEILCSIGKIPKLQKKPKYDAVQIGIKWPNETLKKRIHDRLIKRLKIGMIKEVENLHEDGVSWKRLESFGLEYRFVAMFLQNKISRAEMTSQLENKIWQYAKRQKTWFQKDKRINWFANDEKIKIMNFLCGR
jgi:tRNA dimethylallyltransferase